MKIDKLKYYLIPAFWIIVTLLMIGQDVLFNLIAKYSLNWSSILIIKVKWLVYIPVTFFVFWIAEKLPLNRPKLVKKLLIHLLVSWIVSFVAVLIYSAIQ